MENEQVPVLFSNATSWLGRPFLRFVDFVDRVTVYPDFTRKALEIAKDEFKFKNLDELDTAELRERVETFMRTKQNIMKSIYRSEILQNPHKLFNQKYLRYGKVLTMNSHLMTDPEKTFILPIFIKPGRTHFILRTQ